VNLEAFHPTGCEPRHQIVDASIIQYRPSIVFGPRQQFGILTEDERRVGFLHVEQDVGGRVSAVERLLLEVMNDDPLEHHVGEFRWFDVGEDRVQYDPTPLIVHDLSVYPIVVNAFRGLTHFAAIVQMFP